MVILCVSTGKNIYVPCPPVHLPAPSIFLPMSTYASDHSYDKEKGIAVHEATHPVEEVAPEDALVRRYGRFGPVLAKLFASGVEARGVERVPEDQRETKNMWNK